MRRSPLSFGDGPPPGMHLPGLEEDGADAAFAEAPDAAAGAPPKGGGAMPKISLVGSVALTLNNLAGPGMLAIPVVFQQAGWVPTSLVLLLFWAAASLSATAMCESIDVLNAIVRQNPRIRFREKREFSNVVRFFYGDVWYVVTQLAFNVSLQSLNIASIIVSAQAVDNLLISAFGQSKAVQFAPELDYVTGDVPGEDVFGTDAYVLTLGYVLLLMVFVPMGFMDLADNITLQYASTAGMLLILTQFVGHFLSRPLSFDETPPVGDNMTQLVGIVAFSFAFTTLVPSWYADKARGVSTNAAMWISTTAATVMYFTLGLLAAWAYPGVKSDNILNVMSNPSTDTLTRVCVSLFSLGTIAPGIAVRSIMLRLNLERHEPEEPTAAELDELTGRPVPSPSGSGVGIDAGGGAGGAGASSDDDGDEDDDPGSRSGLCSSRDLADWCTCSDGWATFWANVSPWLVAFIFYEGSGFAHMINWTSLIVNGTVCFTLPFLVYLKAIALKRKLLPSERTTEHIPLLAGRGGGRGGGGNGDDDDDDDDDAGLVPPSDMPTIPVRPPPATALPCLHPRWQEIAGRLLLLGVTSLLIVQIGVNLFYLVFDRQGILD